MTNETITQEEIILDDNQVLCLLTSEAKKATSAEVNLQSVVRMLNEEYGFDLDDMERDFKIEFVDPDTGKAKKQKVELVVFEKGKTHIQDTIIRICIIQDDKIKENDNKK